MKFNREPNVFVVESVRGLKPGRALDVAMGQGRNALFLAEQGWDVTGFDISEVGVRQALDQADKRGLKIKGVVQSDREFDFGTEFYDLVVLCYLDLKPLAERVQKCLKPGGLVLVEYYHTDTRKMRPVISERSAFADNELLQLFTGFRILDYKDFMGVPDWTVSGNEKHRLVRLLAQKKPALSSSECSFVGKSFSIGGEYCWEGKLIRCGNTGWDIAGPCR